MSKIIFIFISFLLTIPAWAADVNYPKGYRNWTHVKSMQINPGHPLYDTFGGIHHLYANGKAMQGYKTGNFPNGSVIVFDLLEAKTENNTVTEGARKVVGVMKRDTKAFKETGGWGFEGFKGNSKTERAVGKNAATACFQCHTSQEKKQFVFSEWRE